MKPVMKSFPKRLLLAGVLAACSATALAQMAGAPANGNAQQVQPSMGFGPAGGGFSPQRMRERMADRRAHMLERFKEKLQITQAQEGAWNAFAAALQPPADGARPRLDREAFAKMTTPERIDAMEKMQSERAARMHQIGEAVKALYAQLTPYQKGLFDAQPMPHRFGPHGMGRGGMER